VAHDTDADHDTDEVTPLRQVRFTGRKPLSETGRLLTEVSMGRRPADRVITGGKLVNVHTREILDADVAIADGRVACFGDVAHCVGPDTEVTDAAGAFLVPGLVDTHVHVESTLVTVRPFADAALRAGTTTVLIENHDMANVFGAEGIRWMLEESRDLLLKVLLAVPACVPPLPGLEDSGAWLDPGDVEKLLDQPGVGALGEMMNMRGITDGDDRMHAMISAALRRGLIATGHWSLSGWNDHRLHAYAACGVDSCHESISAADALAKLRAGMWVQFREGSAFHDMAALAPLLTSGEIDPRHVMFITDDVAPDFLLEQGHLDNAVRVAVAHGVDPVLAIQAATVAPAEYLGLRHDIGSIAPGRFADILFVTDLRDFRPHRVLVDGTDIDRTSVDGTGSSPRENPRYEYPPAARLSVRIPGDLSAADLRIPAPGDRVRVRAIGMVDRVVPTEHVIVETAVRHGEVTADVACDLAKVALVNRHGGAANSAANKAANSAANSAGKQVALGFVRGLGLTGGAIAQSTARDTHHLLAVGMNDADMITAARAVVDDGGGIAVVAAGQVLARLPLPIAGLLSDGTVEEAAAGLRSVVRALAELGCAIEQPTTMLAMLAVSAIPELRIGNRGLIDSRDYRLVPPVVS
jgi:adenine deaminase